MSKSSPSRPSGALQFRRKASGTADPTRDVDWDEVDRELARVDPAFSDPRFDSFRHVLAVLGSINAEEELEKLREQKEAVEALVDSVVDTYYSGFNKSLQNYSQILKLFTESRSQLETLRRSLESAQRQLASRPTLMRELYQRDLMLGDVERLLDDVASAVEVPAKVHSLQQSGEWSLAVAALLGGCNKAAREELEGVGALREVRAELGLCRSQLEAALVSELEGRAYRQDGGGGGSSVQTPPRAGRRCGAAAGVASRTVPRPQRPSSSYAGMDPTEGAAAAVAADAANATPAQAIQGAGHRRAATYSAGAFASLAAPPSGSLFGVDGHFYNPEVPLATLVDCVAQLGGVPAALRAVRAHMPQRMRGAVIAALESFPRGQWLSGDIADRAGAAVGTAAVAAAMQALLDHVFDACMACFQSLARLLQLLALARPPRASAGLEMLLRMAGEEPAVGAASLAPAKHPQGPAAAREECRRAWDCIQMECQELLAALLDAPPPTRQEQRSAAAADVPGAGWLASVDKLEVGEQADSSEADDADAAGPAEPGALSFSLEQEAGEPLVPVGPTTGAGASASLAAADLKPLVARILGGHPGGWKLVAAAYAPVMRFSEGVDRLLAGMEDGTPAAGGGVRDSPGRASSLLQLQVPWRSVPAADHPGAAAAAEHALLRSYLDSYLRMEFLPAVYVDFRARCSAILDDSEAFRPRMRLRGAYHPGAALLPAATTTVDMIEDLLGWAAQVPPFAAHLAGVLENVLGRILGAFQGQVQDAEGSCVAGRLAESVQMVQLMAKEPAAALLGSPVAFSVGRNAEPMDSFVSSVIAAGFGAREGGVEREVLGKLMAERPVIPASLLSSAAAADPLRLVALATLADSVDHVADAIQRCAAAAAAATTVASECDTPLAGGSGAAARAEGWQRQLSGRLRQWRGLSGRDSGFADGLSHVADRYRALAGQIARALRLDLMLTLIHHLQWLPKLGAGGAEADDAEEHAAALARVVARLDDDLAAYLAPDTRAYVFASLPAAAVYVAVALLPEFAVVESGSVARVCRVLSALQPVLCAAGGGGGAGRGPDGARQLEKAKLYYSLLTHSADSLVAAAEHKPRRFTTEEYLALLAANVPGRRVTPEHGQRLQAALKAGGDNAAANGGSKPGKR